MEVKDWSYQEYPEYQPNLEYTGVIESSGDELEIRYFHDVVYDCVDGHDLHLQIFMPQTRNVLMGVKPSVKYPGLVWVRGSAWKKQYVYGDTQRALHLAQLGIVVAVVEYRGSDVAQFPAPIVDARNAVRFMRKNADEYCVDMNRIYLGGESSGGHTAVYAGIRHNDETEENHYPGISAEVCGIIDFYGSVSIMFDDSNPTTIDHCLETSPEGLEMGGVNLRERQDLRELLSIECQIRPETEIVPLLIVHGTKDRTVNPKVSDVLYRRLIECGKQASLYMIQGADHGGVEFTSEPVLNLIRKFMELESA